MNDTEKETAIREGLKNLPVWLIDRCKIFIGLSDYTRFAEEMYRQGFNDGVKWQEGKIE